MQDTTEIFFSILDQAKAVDPVNARKWFDELVLLKFDGGLLEIGCPDESKARYLRENCLANFTKAAQNVTGHLVGTKFSVTNMAHSRSEDVESQWSLKLHPDYSFDSFVVGPCNRLAHASCVAVSHSPGNTYNPLFLYHSVSVVRISRSAGV